MYWCGVHSDTEWSDNFDTQWHIKMSQLLRQSAFFERTFCNFEIDFPRAFLVEAFFWKSQKSNELFSLWTFRTSLFIGCSGLYCLILVVGCLVFLTSEIVTHHVPLHYFEVSEDKTNSQIRPYIFDHFWVARFSDLPVGRVFLPQILEFLKKNPHKPVVSLLTKLD